MDGIEIIKLIESEKAAGGKCTYFETVGWGSLKTSSEDEYFFRDSECDELVKEAQLISDEIDGVDIADAILYMSLNW